MNKQTVTGLILIGVIIGGFTTFGISTAIKDDKPTQNNTQSVSTSIHNDQATAKLKSLKGDDFDKAFMVEMIEHHEGAIDMAKLIEANAKHDELKKLGQDIISAQSKEIDMMQAWQTDWDYKSTSQSHETNDSSH
ncbi:MAG: DUF305 domain-containing protein [Patescibacteria group bacterium]